MSLGRAGVRFCQQQYRTATDPPLTAQGVPLTLWRRTSMKLTCLPEKLNEGLAIVGRVVAPRSTLPVLGNVLLATEGGQLKLAATNLELTVVCWVGAKVEEEGAITLPA